MWLARERRARPRPPGWLQKNFKVVGIAESFTLGGGVSVYAGVAARRDGAVEAVDVDVATLGGTDGTEAAGRILERLVKPDVNLVMLDGCIVSFYNWIDGEALWRRFSVPVACYVFEEPEGDVAGAVRRLFPDWEARLRAMEALGRPVLYASRRGYRVHVRAWGIQPEDAGRAAELTSRFGRLPEAIRLAKLVARAVRERGHVLKRRL